MNATVAKALDQPALLRPPDEVMRLDRMGAGYPTRLSFSRSLLRAMAREQAIVTCERWAIGAAGFGHAVYTVRTAGPAGGGGGGRSGEKPHAYSLVAFATELDPAQRTDRVIAEAWDTSYVLFDGVPDDEDIARLEANVPLQEAGRCGPQELTLSRANKSVRLFEHVVERLAKGEQPDDDFVVSVGYLMRTTAVYGNGKFGIADRDAIVDRPLLAGPFMVEMLTVWLIRGFTHDLVDHLARARAPETAVPLAARFRRYLGIGNSTGLGMAPFLVTHPMLLNQWMLARESALAEVRSLPRATDDGRARVITHLQRALGHLEEWQVNDRRQAVRLAQLREELSTLAEHVDRDWLAQPYPYDALLDEVVACSTECQELTVALVLEANPATVDPYAEQMATTALPTLKPGMRVGELRELLDAHYGWALSVDFERPSETQRFWYVSEEKLEPRLGERYSEPGAEREQALDIARQAQALARDAADADAGESVAQFLVRHPGHRHVARRVQSVADRPYAEIRDNLIGEQCLPIDMLRCKLAFFGATRFDPRSDRWTRIALFQGAPLASELKQAAAHDCWLPVLGGVPR